MATWYCFILLLSFVFVVLFFMRRPAFGSTGAAPREGPPQIRGGRIAVYRFASSWRKKPGFSRTGQVASSVRAALS